MKFYRYFASLHYTNLDNSTTVEKHKQLELPRWFLLPNFLMFSLHFLQPSLTLTFEFGIVEVNPRFVDNDHSLVIPVIQILNFLRVLLSQPEMMFHLFLCEQMRNPHGTQSISLWIPASVFGSVNFRHGQEACQCSSKQMSTVFNDGSNGVCVDFGHWSSSPTTLWCIMNWLSTVFEFFMPLFNVWITQTSVSESLFLITQSSL